jgi:hypothetical protein
MKSYELVIIYAFVIISLVAVCACTGSQSTSTSAIVNGANQGKTGAQNAISNQATYIPTPTESQTDRNIRIANQIVADYHKSHTYTMNDYFVCADMASDVWDMLKTQGINAKIQVGRIDYPVTKITEANHAWVLAEVAPDQWLALETTGGFSVSYKDKPLYYQGWPFYNPKQLKNYIQYARQLDETSKKYSAAVNDYNNYLEQYNQAGVISRLSMKSVLEDKKLIVQSRLSDYNQVVAQINSLTANL